MSLEQVFLEFADENKLEYRFGFANDNETKNARFFVNYDDFDYETLCFFIEKEDMIIVSIDVGIELDNEIDSFKALNNLNGMSKLATFFLDELTGKVLAKTTHVMVGTDEEKLKTLSVIIFSTVITANAGKKCFDGYEGNL